MRVKIIFVALATLLMTGCEEKKFKIPAGDVPQVVVTSFQQKYPNAQVVEWEAEKENEDLVYEVGFKVNDKKVEAAFNADGTLKKEE